MKEYQLKFDIFNVNVPIIEEVIKHEVKQENKAKVVLSETFIEVLQAKGKTEEKEDKAIEIKI